MKPINLGIIGCGIAATELHLPALNKLKNMFKIILVCNHTEQKAKKFAKLAGNISYVLDYKELLSRPDIEAVDIALPIYMNYKVTKDALEAGKHVFIEKPIASNLSEAKKMVSLQKKYNKVLLLAENFRYLPVIQKVKKLINENKIGVPYAVIWNVFHFMDKKNKYAQTKWRIKPKHIGGFITDGGVHYIAGIRSIFGELESGTAFIDSINPEIGAPDTFSLQFKTDKNINGVFNLFFSANGFSENNLIIFGKNGSMIVSGKKIIIKKTGYSEEKIVVDTNDEGGFIAEFKNFYYSIRKGEKILSSFSDGYQDLKIIIKAISSAESGKKVLF